MAQRNRAEARWTHEEATVKGGPSTRNRLWAVLVLVAVAAVVITFTWRALYQIEDVTFEVQACEEPLTAQSSAAQVEAAGCAPMPVGDSTLTLIESGSWLQPDTTGASSWTFEGVAVRTSDKAVQLDLADSAQSVVLVESDTATVRRALTGDMSGHRWTANVGYGGPTTFWLLVTP